MTSAGPVEGDPEHPREVGPVADQVADTVDRRGVLVVPVALALCARGLRAAGLQLEVGDLAALLDAKLPSAEERQTGRQDTRQVLGIVGDRYRIVQNVEAFRFLDQLIGTAMHFETAGSPAGGRRIWVLARLPEYGEVGGDRVKPYVLVINGQRLASHCLR
jgi:hypothetical protein